MPEVILWRNSAVKGCPYCWYSEGWNLNILRDHLVKHHHALVAAFAASQGIADLVKAAWCLVDEAKMPKIPPQVERLDERWALLERFITDRD